jgi:FAD binding domain
VLKPALLRSKRALLPSKDASLSLTGTFLWPEHMFLGPENVLSGQSTCSPGARMRSPRRRARVLRAGAHALWPEHVFSGRRTCSPGWRACALGREDVLSRLESVFLSLRNVLSGQSSALRVRLTESGIHDAHNLAWKLAAVLNGTSTPRLLETYDSERRPVAWLRHQQIFARPDYQAEGNGVAAGEAIIDDAAMEFGQLYRSEGILGAGGELAAAARPDEWRGQPGTRAPHAWVERLGARVSTLDLFRRGWVLLATDARWEPAATAAGASLGIDVESLRIGHDVQSSDVAGLRDAFRLGEHGASLIRPDGYVAWRSLDLPADPTAALREALARVSFATRGA